MQRIYETKVYPILLLLIFITLIGCGAAGTKVQNPPTGTVTAENFPTNFAVASPLASESSSSSSSLSSLINLQVTADTFEDIDFTSAVDRINNLLNGSTENCEPLISPILFDPALADCFGPRVIYDGLPDAPLGDPDSGTTPPGDLMIWLETNSTATNNPTEACSAAQLNSRLKGVAQHVNAGIEGFASMICAANKQNIDVPDADGESITTTHCGRHECYLARSNGEQCFH